MLKWNKKKNLLPSKGWKGEIWSLTYYKLVVLVLECGNKFLQIACIKKVQKQDIIIFYVELVPH